MRGNDERQLNWTQQKEICSLIQTSDLKSSTFVYNSHEAKRKMRNWMKTFPWIKPHYAIKSNPSIPILKDFMEEGSNFDCASKGEIQTLLQLGVSPSDIVYSNPIKDENDLEWAGKQQIELTTADTIEELVKIKQYAPAMKILWRIAIKENSSDNLSSCFSGKFGDDLDSEEKIHERMKEIHEMGVVLTGIHFHCGSGLHGSSAFDRAVLLARECIRIGREYGHEMNILDIGGGFPAGQISQKTIEALKVTENDPLNYKVYAEPGRHFSSYSFYVLTKVIGHRVKNGKNCYHLNESVYHTLNNIIMDGVSFEKSLNQFYSKTDSQTLEQSGICQSQNSTLFGMTCDGLDVIAKDINTPVDLKVGDWLCISGMGAYTYGSRTEFNGMKSIEKILKWSSRVDNNYAEAQLISL